MPQDRYQVQVLLFATYVIFILTTEKTLMVTGREIGRGMGEIGIKEGTCDEHWVLYISDEPLNSTPETNITLHIN